MSINHDFFQSISDLTQCATSDEASTLTRNVIQSLGAQSFVYATLLKPRCDSTMDNSHYFIGCVPELCMLYSKRMWLMNDPFLEYARTNSAPIVGSKIRAKTQGQAEMKRLTSELGFRSGLVVPTHTSMASNKRMGLLYIGCDQPEELGEAMLLRSRVQFGALGLELLLWWSGRLRQQAIRKFSLVDDEVEILQLSKNGLVAAEIAAIFDIKLTLAYKKLNLIKEKFNVDRIEHAVSEAESVGLLG